MKKNYALLICMILYVNSIYAQIPNPSFETWNTTIFMDLIGWGNSNQDAVRNLGVVPVTQINGQTGFGVKMLTIMAAGGLAEAYITNGDPFQGNGGVPCGPNPTAITGYYRYNIQPADSAIILVVFKSGGAITSTDIIYITGTQNTFTPFSFPLSLAGTADTVIIAATSSNLVNQTGITPGSFLELDGLALAGTSVPIVNGAFENWTTLNFDQLIGWEGYGDISKTADHHDGFYAVKLTTQVDNNLNINSAGITSGHNSNSGPSGGMPYTLTADTLTGYYKYIAGNDSAYIYVTLSQNGIGVGGNYKVLHPTSIYNYFEMGLFAGLTPDTIRIDANSSSYPLSPASIGSTLYLDELKLKSQTTGVFNLQGDKAEGTFVYPNPISEKGVITLPQPLKGMVDVAVYDVAGRMVIHELFNNTSREIPLHVEALNDGMYYYQVTCGNIRMQNKFVKK